MHCGTSKVHIVFGHDPSTNSNFTNATNATNEHPPTPHRLESIVSALREPPLPRMSAHDQLDASLFTALDGDDASGALNLLFRGASLKAPLPKRLAHERAFSIRDRFMATDMLSPQSARMIKQFEELVEAACEDRAFDPISWTSSRGLKMIHLCAAGNHVDGLRALLDAGMDPNAASKSERTPLSFAAEYNCMATLDLLLGGCEGGRACGSTGHRRYDASVLGRRGVGFAGLRCIVARRR